MKKLASLSVFFPAYNDAKILPYLICKVFALLPSIAKDFEVIVINDGSKDETFQILELLKKRYQKLIVIHHKKNKGYGAALISGFKTASKEWVFYTDGDGQYNPEDLIKLVAKVREGIDVINGYKIKRQDSLLRIIIGKVYNYILHKLYPVPISDIDCDFRLIRRNKLQKISLAAESGLICLELILQLKNNEATFEEVGVTHARRTFGKSQFFHISHLWQTFREHHRFLARNKKLKFYSLYKPSQA